MIFEIQRSKHNILIEILSFTHYIEWKILKKSPEFNEVHLMPLLLYRLIAVKGIFQE